MEENLHATPFTTKPLISNWTFKQGGLTSTHKYFPANDLPTEVHRDLHKNGTIADPFKDLNELSVRWVGDEAWTYRTKFPAPINYKDASTITVLKFEGLDTFASVYLNDQKILETDNMFLEHRVNVSETLKSEDNILEITFDSARRKGLDIVEQRKDHRFIVHQTEISRGPVRKAQYDWGWDWGPILLTCGPWKPISIEAYTCRLYDLCVRYDLGSDLNSAEVKISVRYEGSIAGVSFTIVNNRTNATVASGTIRAGGEEKSKILEFSLPLHDLELWWPRGYGKQVLYTVQTRAHMQFEPSILSPIHSVSQRFGFRKVELVQEPDVHGTSFYFRINKIDIFCGGSCWIPADSFLTRITSEQYRRWVELAAEGNQTMLRVWGGGIYESDVFFDAADEFGVLVWQDFAFACANYPAYPEYLKSVEEEARQNVRRLRSHPSLVIWAGNNEDYQIVERYGLEYDLEEQDPQAWLKTNFPARYIYEHLLPAIITDESPDTPYHPSSPFGNGKSTVLKVDSTIGDVHQWNVWHGTMEPYQRLPELGGRYISEFGMEAYPHVFTLEKSISREQDRQPGSLPMDFRNKAIGHERRLISYVAENFRIRYDFEGFTHLTQIMQADAMSWAYKSWRRQWGSAGSRRCGGVLVWQLNDCWPTMSWAVVDYYLVPKPAYHAIKRAMAPAIIGVQRKFKSWTMRPSDKLWQRDTGHIDMSQIWQDTKIDVWVTNSTTQELTGEVLIEYISIKTGLNIGSGIKRDVSIAPNGTTEILQNQVAGLPDTQVPNSPFNMSDADPFIIHALLFVDRHPVASDVAWPDPIKYLSFDDRDVQVSYSESKTEVFISAKKPVKGFVFAEKEGVGLSDNGFDIVPGEMKTVQVKGCAADELKWRYVEM
ncbi:glycoside hydrolase superfamily [Pyrenochaeta sp. MPI-SDFR-AT-0127]|nr:glycoside hydrolase superfamily [Pyrenochaeta sp. MPI-SDFR-AT-0127]